MRGVLRPITFLYENELSNIENNYRRKGQTAGGPWSLSEVLQERAIRNPNPDNPEAVIHVILGDCACSPTGRISYKDLWDMMAPKRKWHRVVSRKVVSEAMKRVIEFCVYHQLPVFAFLVGEEGGEYLSDADIEFGSSCCRLLECDVGPNPAAFAVKELKRAQEFIQRHVTAR